MVMDTSRSSTVRPCLPRLRNKASLGRLNAYGGVLDFEVSSSDKQQPVKVDPISSRSSSSLSLAGPAVTSSTTSHNHNTSSTFMQGSSSKQQDDESDNHMSTPRKNTSQATLRALKMLDREASHQAIKYSTSSSVVIPIPIPILDLDHHHPPPQQSETEQGEQQRRGSHSQSRSVSDHGQAATFTDISSTLPISSSPLDADLDVDVDGVPNNGSDKGVERAAVVEEEKDEERLVREIREDMDDGGYASLEQVGISFPMLSF